MLLRAFPNVPTIPGFLDGTSTDGLGVFEIDLDLVGFSKLLLRSSKRFDVCKLRGFLVYELSFYSSSSSNYYDYIDLLEAFSTFYRAVISNNKKNHSSKICT